MALVENSPAEKALIWPETSVSRAGWKAKGFVTSRTELLLSAGLTLGFNGSETQELLVPALFRCKCILYI